MPSSEVMFGRRSVSMIRIQLLLLVIFGLLFPTLSGFGKEKGLQDRTYKSVIYEKVWSCDNPHFGNKCSYNYVFYDGQEFNINRGISVEFYADLIDGINANILNKLAESGYEPCIEFIIGGASGSSLIVKDLLPRSQCS